MAKLVEILARELKEWPEGVDCLGQWPSGVICNIKKNRQGSHDPIGRVSMSDDEEDVTRAQWEVERARIANDELIEDPFPDTPDEALQRAANRKATQEAREIAKGGYVGSATVSCTEGEEVFTPSREEQELVNIACGKRSKEDQALWDKVAKDLYCQWVSIASSKESWRIDAEHACNAADAFMAERAKRMKGGV